MFHPKGTGNVGTNVPKFRSGVPTTELPRPTKYTQVAGDIIIVFQNGSTYFRRSSRGNTSGRSMRIWCASVSYWPCTRDTCRHFDTNGWCRIFLLSVRNLFKRTRLRPVVHNTYFIHACVGCHCINQIVSQSWTSENNKTVDFCNREKTVRMKQISYNLIIKMVINFNFIFWVLQKRSVVIMCAW